MRYLFLLWLFVLALPAQADKPKNSCNDPEINQQWEQALNQYPNDRLLIKLSSIRGALCSMIKNKQVTIETARSIWEQALTDALLERAREDQAQRGLLRLFGTF